MIIKLCKEGDPILIRETQVIAPPDFFVCIFSVLCTLFFVLCSLYSALCTLLSVLCSLYFILYTLFSGICSLFPVAFFLYVSYHHTLISVLPQFNRVLP